MSKGRFKSVAEICYQGQSKRTRIILESDKAIATTFGTFVLRDGKWLYVRDFECELKPERIE